MKAQRFYSRRTLNVETYDERTEVEWGSREDTVFFVDQAREIGGPVLELGAGTGRVVWAIAESGFEVVGLDLSEPMLRRAEEKGAGRPDDVRARARFVRADMSEFEVDQEFGLVISPFRAFQSLLTPEAQRASLECVHRHLRSGGRVVLNLFDPRLDRCAPGAETMRPERTEVRHPQTGNRVRVNVVSRKNDSLRQVLEEVWRFTEIDAQERVVRTDDDLLQLRWTYRHEMRYLLELCGFEVEAEYSDFQRSPPAYGLEQVWVARRP